jgi:chromosome partitioning protein
MRSRAYLESAASMSDPSINAFVIGVQNPKGGTGKTTIAVHLARAAQLAGNRALVIDTDTQGSARDWRARSPEEYDGPRVQPATNPRTLVSDIAQYTDGYDVAVVDGSARLERMTGAVVGASDALLIPVQPSALDLWGTVEFIETVMEAHEEGDVTAAFVASRRVIGTNLESQITGALEDFGLDVLPGTGQRVAYARSIQEGQTVLDGYDEKATTEVNELLEDVGQLV